MLGWQGAHLWGGCVDLSVRGVCLRAGRVLISGWFIRQTKLHILGHQVAVSWQIQICYSESSSGGPGPILLSNLDTAPVSFSLRTLGRCLLVTMVDFVTVGLSCGVRLSNDESGVRFVLLSKHWLCFTGIHAFMQGYYSARIAISRCNRLISLLFLVSIVHHIEQFEQN